MLTFDLHYSFEKNVEDLKEIIILMFARDWDELQKKII